MFKFVLFFLALTNYSFAQIELTEEEIARSIITRVLSCTKTIDWTRVYCGIEDQEAPYDYSGITNHLFRPYNNVFGVTLNTAKYVYNQAIGNSDNGYITRQEVKMIVKEFLAKNKTFNYCKKVAFLSCVSSHVLKYDDKYNKVNRFIRPLEYSYKYGKGVCLEFANVFYDIANDFGVKAWVGISSRHGYNIVQTPRSGRYLILEPQSSVDRRSHRYDFINSNLDDEKRDEVILEINNKSMWQH